MADFVIIPDVTCDLIRPLRERFDIPDYIPGIVYFPDGHCEKTDLDWENNDPIEYYKSMSDRKTLYKSSYATLGDITEVYEKYLSQGLDVLSIVLSSGISGTYQACDNVRKELTKKYPERKIIVIDSLRFSTALSLLLIMAAQKKAEGATIEETAAFVEANKHHIHQIGPMDDLFFLVKTGRISNFKAFFGTLVGVNPMADFNRKGMAEVLAKFKGKKMAFDAVIRYIRETVINPEEQIMFVAHSNRQQAAEALAEMIREEFHPKEIIINHVGMSSGANIGPGLVAAFYYGTEISENCEKEKEIMTNIIAAQREEK